MFTKTEMASTTPWRPDLARWRARAGAMRGRLVSTALTLLGLLVLTFFIGRVMPVDPVLALVGPDADASMYKEAAARLGVDQPVWVQFGRYIAELGQRQPGHLAADGERRHRRHRARVSGHRGTGHAGHRPRRAGRRAARRVRRHPTRRPGRQRGARDQPVRLFGAGVLVRHDGFIGVLRLAGLGRRLGRIALEYDGVVPRATGLLLVDTALAGNWAAFGNAVKHITLPACILGLHSMAFISRMTRSFMLAQLSQEYVLTARVKGCRNGGWSGSTPSATSWSSS
jgi:peptide/nickel transport system permease protein